MFGMSFVYIIFEDNVDVYWARTRVLERLNYAQRLLPQNVVPTLGPDGTGVGHIFWYHLEANGMDLGEQRALQDWYIKFALQKCRDVNHRPFVQSQYLSPEQECHCNYLMQYSPHLPCF